MTWAHFGIIFYVNDCTLSYSVPRLVIAYRIIFKVKKKSLQTTPKDVIGTSTTFWRMTPMASSACENVKISHLWKFWVEEYIFIVGTIVNYLMIRKITGGVKEKCLFFEGDTVTIKIVLTFNTCYSGMEKVSHLGVWKDYFPLDGRE